MKIEVKDLISIFYLVDETIDSYKVTDKQNKLFKVALKEFAKTCYDLGKNGHAEITVHKR